MRQLDSKSTFGDLTKIVLSQVSSLEPSLSATMYNTTDPALMTIVQIPSPIKKTSNNRGRQSAVLTDAQYPSEQIRLSYDGYIEEIGFARFWENVYPTQARVVLAYVVKAFEKLGRSLAWLEPDEKLPPIQHMFKHALLMSQLQDMLQNADLVYLNASDMIRSAKALYSTPALSIYQAILSNFPQHSSEHRLLHTTGSRLVDCLSGAADPLQLLFRSKENKELLEDVYASGPM